MSDLSDAPDDMQETGFENETVEELLQVPDEETRASLRNRVTELGRRITELAAAENQKTTDLEEARKAIESEKEVSKRLSVMMAAARADSVDDAQYRADAIREWENRMLSHDADPDPDDLGDVTKNTYYKPSSDLTATGKLKNPAEGIYLHIIATEEDVVVEPRLSEIWKILDLILLTTCNVQLPHSQQPHLPLLWPVIEHFIHEFRHSEGKWQRNAAIESRLKTLQQKYKEGGQSTQGLVPMPGLRSRRGLEKPFDDQTRPGRRVREKKTPEAGKKGKTQAPGPKKVLPTRAKGKRRKLEEIESSDEGEGSDDEEEEDHAEETEEEGGPPAKRTRGTQGEKEKKKKEQERKEKEKREKKRKEKAQREKDAREKQKSLGALDRDPQTASNDIEGLGFSLFNDESLDLNALQMFGAEADQNQAGPSQQATADDNQQNDDQQAQEESLVDDDTDGRPHWMPEGTAVREEGSPEYTRVLGELSKKSGAWLSREALLVWKDPHFVDRTVENKKWRNEDIKKFLALAPHYAGPVTPGKKDGMNFQSSS